MSSSLMAMGIATFLVLNLVIGLGVLSLLFGTFETLFGKPKLTILKSNKNGNYFAFGLKWNSAKEPASIDQIKLRLFNPFGSPTQVEISKPFEAKKSSFAEEVEMGPGFIEFLGAQNFDQAQILVEIASTKDGVSFRFDMKGTKFKQLIVEANQNVAEYVSANKLDVTTESKPPIDIPIRSFIADTVPGKGAQLVIPTNPAFAAQFAGVAAAPAAGGGAAAPAAENYKVAKVWIEPGCIVC
ncbi:MAG: hypothetical protein AB7I27_02465, partial [Bacteriovoracaceae bacterium]